MAIKNPSRHWIRVRCPLCKGSGKRGDRVCPLCKGEKTILVPPEADE